MEEEYSHLVYLIIIHYCDCVKHTHIRPVLQLFSLPVAARANILGNSILMMAEGPFFLCLQSSANGQISVGRFCCKGKNISDTFSRCNVCLGCLFHWVMRCCLDPFSFYPTDFKKSVNRQ